MKKEVWKDIKEYKGIYQISNSGNVRSISRNVKYSDGRVYYYESITIKARKIKSHGYYVVTFTLKGVSSNYLVHRLVVSAFLKREIVNHYVLNKDINKLNNNVGNLEWCNRSYDMVHALDNTNLEHCLGEGHHSSYLTETEVLEIYHLSILGGIKSYEIAEIYGTTKSTVSNIKLGKTWKRVTGHE